MIEPFDSEFLSQELRDAWKKIERLEQENKELKEQIELHKKHDNTQYRDWHNMEVDYNDSTKV